MLISNPGFSDLSANQNNEENFTKIDTLDLRSMSQRRIFMNALISISIDTIKLRVLLLEEQKEISKISSR